MIAFTLLVLVAIYCGLLIVVGIKIQSWKPRLIVWGILLAWPAYETWSYQSVRFEHKHACEKEGGLRIFTRPEKTDRIRLDGNSLDERYAKGLLYQFWPRLQVVEAQDKSGVSGVSYYEYTVDPNTVNLRKQSWKFNKTKIDDLNEDFYILSQSDESLDKERKRNKTVWQLTRNGKLIAQWTSLQYYWSTQWLFASMVGWRCFEPGSLGADGKEKYPDKVLGELILK